MVTNTRLLSSSGQMIKIGTNTALVKQVVSNDHKIDDWPKFQIRYFKTDYKNVCLELESVYINQSNQQHKLLLFTNLRKFRSNWDLL